MDPWKAKVRIAARLSPEERVSVSPGRRQHSPRLTGSIVVSVSSSSRARANRSEYHELGDDFEPREGVHKVRDMGADNWEKSISAMLSPSHDCRLSDLLHDVVERLEQERSETLQWAGWVHRDTDHPHAHLVIRTDGLSANQVKHLERAIFDAAPDAYAEIREMQREWTKEREREHNRGPELEP
jgi:hypothetical protein